MKRILMGLGIVTVACSGLTLPDGPPSLDGSVVVWTAVASPEEGFFLQVEDEGAICEILVRRPETRFLRRLPSGELESATADDLEQGLRVRVWTVEPINCPGSGVADAVELFVE